MKNKLIKILSLIFIAIVLLVSCSDKSQEGSKFNANTLRATEDTFCLKALENSTVQIVAPLWFNKGKAALPELYYSTDGKNWKEYKFSNGLNAGYKGEKISLNANEKVYFIGTSGTFSYDNENYLKFKLTGNIDARGQVSNLLNPGNENIVKAASNSNSLPSGAFMSLFDSCTALSTAAKLQLPETGITENCFKGMFSACTSMVSAPVINVDGVADHCFDGMFSGCSNLKSIEIHLENVEEAFEDFAKGMIQGVSSSCILIADESFVTSGTDFSSFTVVNPDEYSQSFGSLCFTALEDSSIAINKVGSFESSVVLMYTTDNSNWYEYTFDQTIPLTSGTSVSFRAKDENNYFSQDETHYYQFVFSSGKIAASGNIMCLLDASGQATYIPAYAFTHLFYGCENLTVAPDIKASTLSSNSCSYMYKSCSNLKKTPELSATRLAEECYKSMFEGCTNLNEISALPAITLAEECYKSMFEGCSALISCPDLGEPELAEGCYKAMFKNCIGLTSVKEIKSKNNVLAENCYEQMFAGCESLAKAPKLPAERLKKECYKSMFDGCEALTSVQVSFTAWDTENDSTKDWLKNVATAGSIVCPNDLAESITTRNETTIPSGWTIMGNILHFTALVDNSSVTLNSTGTDNSISLLYSIDDGVTFKSYTIGTKITLNKGDTVYFKAGGTNAKFSTSEKAYYSFSMEGSIEAGGNIMYLQDPTGNSVEFKNTFYFYRLFYNCNVLTTAPELPATTYKNSCYQEMFTSCTSLKVAPKLYTKKLFGKCFYSMFKGCTSLESAEIQFDTWGTGSYSLDYIFEGCTNLKKITFIPSGTWASNKTNNWVKDIPASGDFYYGSDLEGTSNTWLKWDSSHLPLDEEHKWTLHKLSN